jgi:hypothetical protein
MQFKEVITFVRMLVWIAMKPKIELILKMPLQMHT